MRTLPLLLMWTLAGAQAACNDSNGICSGNSGEVSGAITDAPTGAPLVQPLVAIQSGGLDVPNPDPSRGNPSYIVGQLANFHGNFAVRLPCGNYGVHAYMLGYHAYGAPVRNGLAAKIAMDPLNPNAVLPTVGTAQLNATTAHAGNIMTLTVPVAAGDPADPLSEQVLLLNPTINLAKALNPPSPGSETGYPNGTYTTTFPAPAVGSYTYTVLAATQGGVTGVTTFKLLVTY